MRLAVAALAVLLAIAPAAAEAARWRPPVDAPVARSFDLGPDPFEAGRHRGLDLLAPPGTRVRAPCGGLVAVAGRVGTNGRVVTLRCGPWRLSHMPLATLAVRPGDRARPGALLGTLAESDAHAGLHLGVRRHGSRFGYVDPARFFEAGRRPPPAIPGVRGDRRPRLGRAPRPALVPRPPLVPRPALAPRPALVPHPALLPPPALAPRLSATPPALVAGPRGAPAAGSSPPDGGGVAPWPAWAGLALALAGFGLRHRRTHADGSRSARRPAATAGTVTR